MMTGPLADVPKFTDQSFANLVSGGWLEMADIAYPVKLNDGVFPEDSAYLKWSRLTEEGGARSGRKADCARYYKEQMIAAGFSNVWPTIRWPKDKKLKEIGMRQQENVSTGIEAMNATLFTRVLVWEKSELDVFLGKVRAELKDTKVHTHYNV